MNYNDDADSDVEDLRCAYNSAVQAFLAGAEEAVESDEDPNKQEENASLSGEPRKVVPRGSGHEVSCRRRASRSASSLHRRDRHWVSCVSRVTAKKLPHPVHEIKNTLPRPAIITPELGWEMSPRN